MPRDIATAISKPQYQLQSSWQCNPVLPVVSVQAVWWPLMFHDEALHIREDIISIMPHSALA